MYWSGFRFFSREVALSAVNHLLSLLTGGRDLGHVTEYCNLIGASDLYLYFPSLFVCTCVCVLQG